MTFNQKMILPLSFFSVLLLFACKKDTNDCQQSFEPDSVGNWYKGDFHVHSTGASNDTGGDSSPENIKSIAVERNLDFLVLTDHSNSTGSDPTTTEEDPLLFNLGSEFPFWDKCAELSEPGQFLMIDGNEISPVAEGVNPPIPTGHIGCIPINLESFDTSGVFIDRPRGEVSGADVISQAKDRGCFAILNHPYNIALWTTFDWTSMDYDAIEVWNGTIGFDPYDFQSYDTWICDLLSGKNTIAVGGSDNHRVFIDPPGSGLDPALGYPSTYVFAEDLEWTSIMESLQNGNVMIAEGNSSLYLDAYSSTYCRTSGSDIRILRVRGSVDAQHSNGVLVLEHATACNDPRPIPNDPPTLTKNLLLEQSLEAGNDFEYAVEINGESGVYSAKILPNPTGHFAALSKAVVIP